LSITCIKMVKGLNSKLATIRPYHTTLFFIFYYIMAYNISKEIIMRRILILSLLPVFFCKAGNAESAPGKALIVGIKQSPPFAIKHADSAWSGIAVDLWRDIAEKSDFEYEFREMTLEGVLDALSEGSVDAAVGALTVTAKREQVFDFTHPFYISGLGIAVPYTQKEAWLGMIASFFSYKFLSVVAALGLVLLLAGVIVWSFERKTNPDQFGGSWLKGIGSSFWWSAVTMTTVGYGDKSPKSFGGRLVSMIWMFTGIIVISVFTAAITAALTISQLESKVSGPEDLPEVRTATVPKSTSEIYLHENHIFYQLFETPQEGLAAVAKGEIDAFVYDAPILRYLAGQKETGKVRVLSKIFERQDYAFAFPQNSDLRNRVNILLLERIHDPRWKDTLYEYLGIGGFY